MVYYQFVKPSVVTGSGLITPADLARAILNGDIRVISTPDGQMLDGAELVNVLGIEHDLWRTRVL